MLRLTEGNTEDSITVTLTELCELETPNYLFVFTHSTDQVVRFVKMNDDDLSDHKQRYNLFEIDVPALFPNAPTGDYTYSVFEQEGTGIDETGLSKVECGRMILVPAAPFQYEGYNEKTPSEGYGG